MCIKLAGYLFRYAVGEPRRRQMRLIRSTWTGAGGVIFINIGEIYPVNFENGVFDDWANGVYEGCHLRVICCVWDGTGGPDWLAGRGRRREGGSRTAPSGIGNLVPTFERVSRPPGILRFFWAFGRVREERFS